ncbi:MAG: aldehyde dehydrogenase family protein [Deltaproteobacteria bacterium]|nr:aldehyde dehydrogenase family protein [Deltaproteobacteria bacterium]MBM4324383.1 aldehyde dehydrogenase family protein [Deltaproteobacteria bacterium]
MDLDRQLMLINGQWVESSGGEFIPVENPSRKGSIAGEVPRAKSADVDRAVQAAAKAFEEWKRVSPRERGKLIVKIGEAIEVKANEIARITALETGNAIRTQSRPEAMLAADIFRFFGGLGSEIKGETVPLGENLLSYSRREPIGVVGGIVPWNSPVGLAALKIAMAITAGNTLILKPSSEAPLAVLMVARICSELLPAGVLNVITGTGSECGIPLARHPLVRKLTFTGSYEIGRTIMEAAAERIVPVTLELGGKSPQIVFPDANELQVVDGVFLAMRFTRQGQSCTAGSRLFLHQSIYDPFLEKLVNKLKSLKIGDPLDESTDMGAIINRTQFEKVCFFVKDGIEQKGARLLTGGLPPKEGPLAQGYFMEPTIIGNVQNDWRIAREEIFGPVLVAIPWKEEEEAIRMANESHYGLAAFIWTHDIGKALRTAHRIESGWVQINQGVGIVPGQSYGGFKQSGFGREYSLEGMLESFTQRKSITVNLQF